MGHPTDKIELIVLGGTWCDYPEAYQIWFARELFRALDDGPDAEAESARIRSRYRTAGFANDEETLFARTAPIQARVDAHEIGYNQAIEELYADEAHAALEREQRANLEELAAEHERNETAKHRVVGFVIETRPDTVSPASLALIRRLGCTKVQLGVQTLRPELLAQNRRRVDIPTIERAFDLSRLFGFKIHAHFMVNLLGATPEADRADYLAFATERPYQPDEVKLYPCVLVEGAALMERHRDGSWIPYREEELIDVLVADTEATRPFTRISRMIRDISACDIVAGNKKANLRQVVEDRIREAGEQGRVREIRFREVQGKELPLGELRLDVVPYETLSTRERFLQWITPEGEIAGFLRLSLPDPDIVAKFGDELPIRRGEAMIREVHVYGRAARIHGGEESAQHRGLGRELVETACEMAKAEGYEAMNVISSVGTREYYRKLGFVDGDLYQRRVLR